MSEWLPDIRAGDWVRFTREDGKLVVGVVAYVREEQDAYWPRETVVYTDIGQTSVVNVLEVRRG